ncbi:hypothetical protein HK097_002243 [Rhizophlyctis rosea]|uniref:Cellobiose dehydrogenase-like cytochrome domain-containing protein n=1 Tax=Rhizophlyctis rosea TaxID=64517 RepID=A0AAD5X3A2_9FUNG|nr:hypothetical protein HK097_002243 [Rhizophlyctis rosea]
MQFKAVTLLAAFAGLAQAQTFTSTYVDPVNGLKYQSATENGITFGVALPATSNPTELVVQMRAPASVGWVGGSLGGSMKYSLLLVAWLNAQNQIVVSPRYATDYVMPTPLSGPVITVLKDSGIVNGELKVNVRCQGCTSWAGSEGTQSIATSGFQLLAYAANSFTKPSTPSSASSSLGIHSIFGILPALEMADAQNSDYTSKVNAQLPFAPPLPLLPSLSTPLSLAANSKLPALPPALALRPLPHRTVDLALLS